MKSCRFFFTGHISCGRVWGQVSIWSDFAVIFHQKIKLVFLGILLRKTLRIRCLERFFFLSGKWLYFCWAMRGFTKKKSCFCGKKGIFWQAQKSIFERFGLMRTLRVTMPKRLWLILAKCSFSELRWNEDHTLESTIPKHVPGWVDLLGNTVCLPQGDMSLN